MDDKKLSDAVNRSGFPLQIALQRLVERTRSLQVSGKSFSGNIPGSTPPMIALDLSTSSLKTDVAIQFSVVECKRVVNCSWIFLIDDMKQMERRHAKGWVTRL